MNLSTREKALTLNKKLETTGYSDQVNSVSSLVSLKSMKEQEDWDNHNNLYVAGP